MVDSLNTLCGTNRDVSGKLNPQAGRIAELDEIAKKFAQAIAEEKKNFYLKLKI